MNSKLLYIEGNEEPSVLDGSTGPKHKAKPFLTKQKSFQINENNLACHPGTVSLPGGHGSPLVTIS